MDREQGPRVCIHLLRLTVDSCPWFSVLHETKLHIGKAGHGGVHKEDLIRLMGQSQSVNPTKCCLELVRLCAHQKIAL